MRGLYYKILYMLAMILSMSACSDKTWFSQDSTIEFSLSNRLVEIEPGDTAIIYVSGELEFAVESQNENVAVANREGRKAVITAIAEGETDVIFLSQFNDIVCRVIVKEKLIDDEQKLNDATVRVKGSGISLVYGEPGIMVIKGEGYIEFVDIDTAQSVNLFHTSDKTVSGVEVNGVEYDILSCRILKETDDRLWYKVLLDSEKLEGFWAVIEK